MRRVRSRLDQERVRTMAAIMTPLSIAAGVACEAARAGVPMAAIVTRLLDDDGTPLPATVAARLDRVVMQMSREWDIEDDMTYTAVRDALTAAMGYTMRQIAGAPIGAGVTP